MTKLAWDQSTQRYYETGLDRGVLYLPDGTVAAWNGLISLEEDFSSDTSTPYFVDGVKYLDTAVNGDFAGTLSAFTFPDEFLQCEGYQFINAGFAADEQEASPFSLAFRTLVGNDVNSQLAYKLHICYNLTAATQDVTNVTTGGDASAVTFSWAVTGVPEPITGFAPTVHIELDSRYIHARLLSAIEDILYGTDTTDPQLPSLQDLFAFATSWALITIIDNGDGTWTATGPDDLVYLTEGDTTEFEIDGADVTYIDADTYTVQTTYDQSA